MFKCAAKTVAERVRVDGLGLHNGRPCSAVVHPAEAGSGIAFSPDGDRWTPATVDQATAPGGSTCLGGWLDTPEHLLAALVGVGITDARIAIDGGEVPALDGSAKEWVERLGGPVQTGSTQGIEVPGPLEVSRGDAVARWTPSDRLEIAVSVDFGPSLRGEFEGGLEDFVERWCWARTFLPHDQLDTVREAGRGRGGRPGTVVVWGPRGALVPLRSTDEPIRHKALDALGDLALAGCPIRGRLEVLRGTHALHQLAVRALLDATTGA